MNPDETIKDIVENVLYDNSELVGTGINTDIHCISEDNFDKIKNEILLYLKDNENIEIRFKESKKCKN